jgi:hypothetical protein
MVRVIRTFRPDVLVSRFQGTPRDGHGHHQAAGILTREAFRAAADPARFPEQLREGLTPWQVKKLYVGNLRPPFSTTPLEPGSYTLTLDTGAEDSLLGTSYARFAMEGLKHQLSQGAGSWSVPPGPHISYYKLVDSVLPPVDHEQSFFDGIDTTLPGLATRLGSDEGKFPELRPELVRMQHDVEQAGAAAKTKIEDAASPLLDGYAAADGLLARLSRPGLGLPPAALAELQTELDTKREQFQRAAGLALGLNMQATVQAPASLPGGFMAVRGGTFSVGVEVNSPFVKIKANTVTLEAPGGWQIRRVSSAGLDPASAWFSVRVAADAPFSRPCISRKDEQQAVYTVENDACAVLPLPPPVLHAVATYSFDGHSGRIEVPVEVRFTEPESPASTVVTPEQTQTQPLPETPVALAETKANDHVSRRALAVGPEFSVAATPVTRVIRANEPSSFAVNLSARANLASDSRVTFQTTAASGWKVKAEELPGSSSCPLAVIAEMGQERRCEFAFGLPAHVVEGMYPIEGAVEHNRARYAEGYALITRPDLGSALYYQPAETNVSAVEVKLPQGLKVGYVMGSGDDIPAILSQLGLNVKLIPDAELATGDLNAYDTIVLGIRAYDTRLEVRRLNRRLLDYVAAGGTLVVQYNSGVADFNSANYTPFAAELSRDRVTDEEAPVAMLAPDAAVLNYPNRIAASDFNGWVQERGLYFMSSWDGHFRPLLESHDPSESPLAGGLLEARYGKGVYLYTGYSFFRQLPAGVPGAIRLFVNLVSAGHESLPAR